MLRLLFYKNQYTSFNEAQLYELGWPEFKEVVLSEPEVVANKGSEAQFFPGEMKEDAESKGDASVDSVHLYCVDADDITPDQYQSLIDAIEKEGVECVVYSTYSHAKQLEENGNYRVRAVFPLKRPVKADEWRIFWSNARLTFASVADHTTASPSKHYLVPSLPPGQAAAQARIYREFTTGKFLDPDEMMTRHGLKAMAESEVESFDLGTERISGAMFLDAVGRRHRKEDAPIINALKSALGKNAYAPQGSREQTLFGIAGFLGKEFPRGNPDDLCEPLRYSIEHEEKRGGPKFSEFRDKVIRRQRDYLRRAAQARLTAAKDAAEVVRMKSSVQEYTPENLEPYIKACGDKFTVADLKKALVLVHRNGYYVFDGSGYRFATSNSLNQTVIDRLLYRAETHLDFEYFFPAEGNKPPVPKTDKALVRDHGRSVDEVKYNYDGVSWFDAKTHTLWLSEVKPVSRIIPERVPQVENWLKAGIPDARERRELELWMALYCDTRKALVGLVLSGATGCGKSAFAEGMAKMHGDHPPCSMENYLSSFNSQILFNPLVLADESLPEVNGKVPTDKLRTMISSGVHEVNRKGQPIAVSHGFVRCIMAFQNVQKFDFGRGHTREDIEAIEKRYMFRYLHPEAAEHFDYDLFVTHNGLIKHALYLAQTMTRQSSRFGVDTSGSNTVIAGDPVAMYVADWLLEYFVHKVHSAVKVQPENKRVAGFINHEKIFVNVTMIRKEWENYKTHSMRATPTQAQLADAVRSMSTSPKSVRVRMGSGQESFWEINSKILKNRALSLDMLTPEQFDLLLRIPHELSFKTEAFKLDDDAKEVRIHALGEYKGKAIEEVS